MPRTPPLLRCVAFTTCLLAAACGGDSPTSPSGGTVVQALTIVGPSGAGGPILHRNETATGTVTLSGRASGNGAAVTLQTVGAERTALIIPASVIVASGSATATFPVMVTSSGVSGPAEVTLTASFGGSSLSTIIRLAP